MMAKIEIKKTLLSSSFSYIQFLWMNVYSKTGWEVVKPVKIVWSWRRFDYVYRLIIKKTDGKEETEIQS